MKIIVLVGKPNVGKTATLKKLIRELTKSNSKTLQAIDGASRCPSYISPGNSEKFALLMDSDKDVFVKSVYMDKTIVISTAGDAGSQIENKFDIAQKENSTDYFICASHEKGSSYDYILALEEKYEVIKVYKTGCRGEQEWQSYNLVAEYSDKLALGEIKTRIK